MALPAPKLTGVHGVLQLPDAAPSDPGRDSLFMEAINGEFPNTLNHQMMPADAPPQAPYLVFASSSSQLALSAAQADFEVRFYGEYLDDFGRGLEYVERKMGAVRAAYEAASLVPANVGLVSTFHFAGEDIGGLRPAIHILRNLLRAEVEPDDAIQDAVAKVALRVRDTYFVNLTVSNYEERRLERPIMPGMGPIRIRPWEGTVYEVGLELGLDINNNLEAQVNRKDPVVTDEGIHAVTQLLKDVGDRIGPAFAETGQVSVDALTTGATP